MKFIKPEKRYLKSYYEACVESWNKLHNNYIIHDPKKFDKWKDTIFEEFENNKNGINLPPNYLPSVTYWIISKNDYIGTINIRLGLNDQLKKYGGHIGVAIRKSKQNGIFGYKAFLWGFQKAKELGISPILVTCQKSNTIAVKMLTSKYSNYYKSEEDIIEENGKIQHIMRFWFN